MLQAELEGKSSWLGAYLCAGSGQVAGGGCVGGCLVGLDGGWALRINLLRSCYELYEAARNWKFVCVLRTFALRRTFFNRSSFPEVFTRH